MKRKYILLVFLLAFFFKASAQVSIPSSEIGKHITDSVSTSAKISGGRNLERAQITILYFGGVFPEHLFTVVIKEPARSYFKFNSPDDLKGKMAHIIGKVTEYGGKPQISVTNPNQFKIN